MYRILRLKSVLITGFHCHEIAQLKLNKHVKLVMKDTKNPFLCFVHCCLHYSPTRLAGSLLRQVDPGDGYSLSQDPLNYHCIVDQRGTVLAGNDGDLAMEEEEKCLVCRPRMQLRSTGR